MEWWEKVLAGIAALILVGIPIAVVTLGIAYGLTGYLLPVYDNEALTASLIILWCLTLCVVGLVGDY